MGLIERFLALCQGLGLACRFQSFKVLHRQDHTVYAAIFFDEDRLHFRLCADVAETVFSFCGSDLHR